MIRKAMLTEYHKILEDKTKKKKNQKEHHMKISISTGTLEKRFGTREMFRMMKAAGIEYADYGLDTWHPDADSIRSSQSYRMSVEETIAHYREIKRIADEEGITIYQTHAIFGEFPACECPEYREATVKNIIATNVLGCKYSVIHPVRTPGRSALRR